MSESTQVIIKTSWEGRERRRSPRLECSGNANVRMLNLDSEDSVQFQGRILNLSLLGCCIETEIPTALRINDQLEVYFQLNGFPLLLMGIAKSIHTPQKIGIEFLEVSPRKQDQLKYILNDLKEELAEKKKQSKAQP